AGPDAATLAVDRLLRQHDRLQARFDRPGRAAALTDGLVVEPERPAARPQALFDLAIHATAAPRAARLPGDLALADGLEAVRAASGRVQREARQYLAARHRFGAVAGSGIVAQRAAHLDRPVGVAVAPAMLEPEQAAVDRRTVLQPERPLLVADDFQRR